MRWYCISKQILQATENLNEEENYCNISQIQVSNLAKKRKSKIPSNNLTTFNTLCSLRFLIKQCRRLHFTSDSDSKLAFKSELQVADYNTKHTTLLNGSFSNLTKIIVMPDFKCLYIFETCNIFIYFITVYESTVILQLMVLL